MGTNKPKNKSIVFTLLHYLASAGDIGGIIGKKFGFGWSRALPVIRQNDILTTILCHSFVILSIMGDGHDDIT